MKPLRYVTALILIAGAGLTSRAMYLHAKAELAGVLIRRAWEQTAHSGESRTPWPWADTHPVARLRIPRLGYDEIVLDAATPRTLAFGHRTSWFQPLESIAAGDKIQIEWFNARRSALYERTYAVNFIQIVEPQDVTLLEPTSEDALTLITCYPFGRSPHSPQRYLVRASPLGPSRLVASSGVAVEKASTVALTSGQPN
jgi:sortase A